MKRVQHILILSFTLLFFISACSESSDSTTGSISDAEIVASDAKVLTITYENGDSESSVTTNITLPTLGVNGSIISWSSNNTVLIDNNGLVTQPIGDGNVQVALTATLTKGTVTQTVNFNLTVIELNTIEGGVLITEVHLPILFGSTAEQWIKLYNNTDTNINVEDLSLTLNSNSNSASFGTATPSCNVIGASNIIQPGESFVIVFGDSSASDFTSPSTDIDAVCSPFQLQQTADVISISINSGILDTLDFSTTDFECHTTNQRYNNFTRSIILRHPTDHNNSTNDNASYWCLVGPSGVYSNSGRHLGYPTTEGICEENNVSDLIDDDCNGIIDD